MSQENLPYWLALSRLPGFGPIKIKKLIEQYHSPQAACAALNCEINNCEQEIMDCHKLGVEILTVEDEDYPFNLKNIYDPPPVLYLNGKSKVISRNCLAIVGTRTATPFGLEVARQLGFELAALGITVVSGLALGIDTAAHQGALTAQGQTIAVLGHGVEMIFPGSNAGLGEKIKVNGLLVSEFPLGQKPEKWTFPQRNRIISGLSLGVIVVEGAYDSGAMITAKLAVEQGREVFAVPGNIKLDQTKGPHWLIKQGAKLVENVEDVLEELKLQMPNYAPKAHLPLKDYSGLSSEEQKIISVLSQESKHLDTIAAEAKLSIPQTSSLLMMLEIKKIIRQLPGKTFLLS